MITICSARACAPSWPRDSTPPTLPPAALRGVGDFRPDVVVMDLHMPGMSGIEATSRLPEVVPGASILILTIASDDRRLIEAVRACAQGYLLKNAPLDEIVAGIGAAAAGRSTIVSGVAGALIARTCGTATVRLPATPSQRDPTCHAASSRSSSCSAKGTAKSRNGCFLSQSTVKNHVSRLLGKLGAENGVQAAVCAIRSGLIDGQGLSLSAVDRRPAPGTPRACRPASRGAR